MADCPFCISRRSFVSKVMGTALVTGLAVKSVRAAVAQTNPSDGPQVASEQLAKAHTEYSPFVDGPADFYTNRLTFPPGAVVDWHRHPGPVFAEVISGTLTNHYDTLGCLRRFVPGEAVYVPRDLIHVDANEGSVPLVVLSTFIVPADSPLRIPVDVPAGSRCETTVQGIAVPRQP
jgi:quercetin dioxygenase-like cupin family protein